MKLDKFQAEKFLISGYLMAKNSDCSFLYVSFLYAGSYCITAVFKNVATFNNDFALRDGNRAHQNTFRSCDRNFVR